MFFQSRNSWAVIAAATFTLLTSVASHAGPRDSGGGDLCEDRIKTVRDDIRTWILTGGPQGLNLPARVSVSQYSEQMLSQINSAKIRCVGSSDSGYPVNINGTPKVCRFDRTADASQITCDFNKFNATFESDQYVLVHHELAGLAKIETPNRDDSDYQISNQISGYLEDQIVKKLAVKPSASHSVRTLVTINDGFKVTLQGSSAPDLEADCNRALIARNYPINAIDSMIVQYANGSKVSATGVRQGMADRDLDIPQTCKVVTYYAVASAATLPSEDVFGNPQINPILGSKKFVLAVRTFYSADVFAGSTKDELMDRCLNSGLAAMISGIWTYDSVSVRLNSQAEKYRSTHPVNSKDNAKICSDAVDLAFTPAEDGQ